MEQWKEHQDYPGYEGSTSGVIRSWRAKTGLRASEPLYLKPCPVPNPKGHQSYMRVTIYCGGKSKTIYVHRFIATLFIPTIKDKRVVNHKDGDKANNAVLNLEWVTPSENRYHAFAIGLCSKKGQKHHLAKLDDATVQAIRAESKDGAAQDSLAEKYGVTRSNISMILSGKHWGHLPGADKRDKRDWRRKLTMDDAREVRRRYSAKEATKAQLAVEYGVTFATISEILAGRRYCELPSGVEYG